MIPRTFPSTIDANGNRSMVIFPITTYDPSGRWRDWIPVRGGTNSAKVNTYAEDGGQSMTIIDTLTNKQAWLDYVPVVFVGGNDADAWDVKDIGFIPGFGDVPTFNLNFGMLEFDRTGLTFSRSGDRSATVVDHEGYIWACKANEMRMQGFRRVENLPGVTNSDTLNGVTVGATATFSPGSVTPPTGLSSASSVRWTADAATSDLNTSLSNIVGTGRRIVISFWGRSLDSNNIPITLFMVNGVGGTIHNSAFTLTPSWQRFTMDDPAMITAADGIARARFSRNSGQINRPIGLAGLQIEIVDAAGRGASEYISLGVLSSPFHGFFADGVKYFTTDRNGDDIPEATRLGVLVEEDIANVLLQSETFGTTWATGGTAVVTSDNHISPAGIQNADRYVPNSGVAGILQQTVTPAVGDYTFSCYIKRTGTTLNSIRLQATEGANFAFADFNLDTLAVASGASGMTSVSGTIGDADSNGWRRCVLKFTTITAAATNFLFTLPTASGNAVDGFYLWGAQLENRPFTTSYIPTTTSTVTRGVDLLTASLDSWFSASQGTWLVNGVRPPISSRMILEGNGAGVTIRGVTISTTSAANGMRILQRHGSVRDDQERAVAANIPVKTAMGWDSSGVIGAVNGVATGSTAGVGQADYSTHIGIGRRGLVGTLSANTTWNSTIKSVSYFNYKLPAAILALITA